MKVLCLLGIYAAVVCLAEGTDPSDCSQHEGESHKANFIGCHIYNSYDTNGDDNISPEEVEARYNSFGCPADGCPRSAYGAGCLLDLLFADYWMIDNNPEHTTLKFSPDYLEFWGVLRFWSPTYGKITRDYFYDMWANVFDRHGDCEDD